MTGLYDHQGVLRFAGLDEAGCLAYAELFGLDPGACWLSCLLEGGVAAAGSASPPLTPAGGAPVPPRSS